MKRIFCLCAVLCLLLSGCAGQEADRRMQEALDLRTDLMASEGCSFKASVSADYGERVYTFSLDCTYVPEQEARLTVTQPEEIAGISAAVSADGTVVTFDGVELAFGELANGRVAPMALPWLLGSAWSSGYISSAGADGETVLVTYLMGYGEDEVTVETWLDTTGVPVRCEVIHDGRRYLTVALEDFQLL